MTTGSDPAARLALLEAELALSERVDEVLEGALRERLPLEAYVSTPVKNVAEPLRYRELVSVLG